MPLSRDDIIGAVDSYLDGVRSMDVERILACFADHGASVEDPIGSTPKTGDGVREYYSRPRLVRFLERVGEVAVSGAYGGFTFLIAFERPEGMVNVFIHETMRFDDDGKVTTMIATPDFALGDALMATRKGPRVTDALAALEIIAEISRTKARYVRALEKRDWDLYADCLTRDVVASFAPPVGGTESTVHHGRDHLREWIMGALADTSVVMRVSSPDIDVVDADHARGTWAFVERLVTPDGPYRERTYFGHYYETYARDDDGRWRIASIRISRVRHDVVGPDGISTVHIDGR